jgi:rubrerythrin
MHHTAGPMASPTGCTLGAGSLPEDVRGGIARALADERRSEAEYAQLAKRTPGFPFEHIGRSEARHAFELERLLAAHSHPIPPTASEQAQVHADDARTACVFGVASEKRNIAVYDELLSTPSLPPDVRCVFERLRAASATRHLPAFERCAGR